MWYSDIIHYFRIKCGTLTSYTILSFMVVLWHHTLYYNLYSGEKKPSQFISFKLFRNRTRANCFVYVISFMFYMNCLEIFRIKLSKNPWTPSSRRKFFFAKICILPTGRDQTSSHQKIYEQTANCKRQSQSDEQTDQLSYRGARIIKLYKKQCSGRIRIIWPAPDLDPLQETLIRIRVAKN